MSEKVKAATKKPEAKRENKTPQTQKTGPSQSISSPVEQILFLQRTMGNQAVERLIKSGALQAKLRIGQPGDIYEQEADRIAEQVMRMPEQQVSKETMVSRYAQNNPIQRRISPEDVSAEMIGMRFQVTGSFTSGDIILSGDEIVEVVAWPNTSTTARVQLPIPYRHAFEPFDIPKRLLIPAAHTVSGMAPYSAGISEVVRNIERGEQAIAREQSRRGGPRPGEIERLEGLQRNRERLLNRRLIQQAMFNRFDSVIKRWTDHYNQEFGYTGANALDPNLVKSMLFQESQIGTSGQHLEEPPSHPVKTRYNLGQVIDSSGSALLIMMQEMQPDLIITYHLENIRTDLSNAQQELRTLRNMRNLNPTQRLRFAELVRLSRQSWEVFLWEYRASGQNVGFGEAVTDFFASVGTGQPARNMDYEFWIRTAIRWLFEKRRAVGTWEEAIRAYNGSGERARHYREAVLRRRRAATEAQAAGREYIPENI
jgi:hypothetical protein